MRDEPLVRRAGQRDPEGVLPPTVFDGFRQGVAETLAERLGLELVENWVLRVKTTPTHHIDLIQMAFNWRLLTVPVERPVSIARAWCYTGAHGFVRAYQQAMLWPPDDGIHHVPDLWYKTAYGHQMVERPEHFYK